jgi:hypothetical protein
VSYDEQRARWAALGADQEVIDRAAARLRHETAQDQYRGLRDPQVAFGFAAVLDELSRHLRDLDEALRPRVVELCTELLVRTDQTADSRRSLEATKVRIRT